MSDDDVLSDDEMDAADQAEVAAYLAYSAACRAEECEPHPIHMWRIHGCMSGPI